MELCIEFTSVGAVRDENVAVLDQMSFRFEVVYHSHSAGHRAFAYCHTVKESCVPIADLALRRLLEHKKGALEKVNTPNGALLCPVMFSAAR